MSRKIFYILMVIITGIIAYSNTLNAPFIWDDNGLILENTRLRDLSNFKDLSGTRYLTYLTFAINYAINRYDVTGYHIFNIAVHIINAMLIYWLVLLIFRLRTLLRAGDRVITKDHEHEDEILRCTQNDRVIALFSGLLFVAHPVYTQAVTYINQRSALLVTMFYLLSVVMYIRAEIEYQSKAVSHQQSAKDKRRHIFYSISVMSAALAMKSKEIAFTLPFVILIFDRYFFGGQRGLKKSVIYLIPILLTMLIIPLDTPQPEVFISQDTDAFRIEDGSILSGLDATRLSSIPRKDYMVTQLRVILTYIRLFFFPVNLNLDYDYPVFSSFLSPSVFLSFIFLISLLALAVYLYYRSRPSAFSFQYSVGATLSEDSLRAFSMSLISFGILWFFISLSIESFVVVLNYVIFEYRLYLPSIGIVLALTGLADYAATYFKDRLRYIAPGVALIVIVLSTATYMRNAVFKDVVVLWQDVVKKAPNRTLSHYNLGNAYSERGRFDEAIEEYKIALRLNPYHFKSRNNLANIYYDKGLFDMAIQEYQIALRLKPDSSQIHYNLGLAYAKSGMLNQAIEEYKIALSLKPNHAEVYNSLGIAYYRQGKTDLAIQEFKTALGLKPNHANAYYNLGNAYLKLGAVDKAIEHYHAALTIYPNFAAAHNSLGLAYKQKGLINEAKKEFLIALKLKPDFAEARQALDSISK